jgi:hypothetical protein
MLRHLRTGGPGGGPLPEVRYGRRKMTAWLGRNGFPGVSKHTVDRLMRDEGMNGLVRGRSTRTTVPAKTGGRRAADLLNRQFSTTARNLAWVTAAFGVGVGERSDQLGVDKFPLPFWLVLDEPLAADTLHTPLARALAPCNGARSTRDAYGPVPGGRVGQRIAVDGRVGEPGRVAADLGGVGAPGLDGQRCPAQCGDIAAVRASIPAGSGTRAGPGRGGLVGCLVFSEAPPAAPEPAVGC